MPSLTDTQLDPGEVDGRVVRRYEVQVGAVTTLLRFAHEVDLVG
jgi:hypothetical protein